MRCHHTSSGKRREKHLSNNGHCRLWSGCNNEPDVYGGMWCAEHKQEVIAEIIGNLQRDQAGYEQIFREESGYPLMNSDKMNWLLILYRRTILKIEEMKKIGEGQKDD